MKKGDFRQECNSCAACLRLVKHAKKLYYNMRDERRSQIMKGEIKDVSVLYK